MIMLQICRDRAIDHKATSLVQVYLVVLTVPFLFFLYLLSVGHQPATVLFVQELNFFSENWRVG
jgi:hypothetical protein